MFVPKELKKLLAPDEKIVEFFGIGRRYRLAFLAGGLVLGLFIMGLASFFTGLLIILAGGFYFIFLDKANLFAFADRRVISRRGWLGSTFKAVDYEKITDIEAEEPFFEKLFFRTGRLKINTAGAPDYEIVFNHVENPYELKTKLELLISKTKINTGKD